MLFGMWTQLSLRYRVLGRSLEPSQALIGMSLWWRGSLPAKKYCRVYDVCVNVCCRKLYKNGWTCVNPYNYVLDETPHGEYDWSIIPMIAMLIYTTITVATCHVYWLTVWYCVTEAVHTHTHILLSVTIQVGWYQKKHSFTDTNPVHQTSFINFLHLLLSIVSYLFNLRAWQFFSTTCL